MWKPSRRLIRLFANYLWIGGLATVVDTGVLKLLYQNLGIFVGISSGIAYVCGMITNFLLNKYLNFSSEDRSVLRQARTFFIVATIGLAIKVGLMVIFVEVLSLRWLLAQVIAVGLVMLWSFWG
ncbi:GtrA family protein, partial [bacterium]|nr:GtrA family protein [bacterium]